MVTKFYVCASRERNSVQMAHGTGPTWPPRPFMVKTVINSASSEPVNRWPRNLVCSIGYLRAVTIVQMMKLGYHDFLW